MTFNYLQDPLLNQGRKALQKLARDKEEISEYEVRTEDSGADNYVQISFERRDDPRDYQIIVDVMDEDDRSDYHVNSNSWTEFPYEEHSHSGGNTSTLNRIYETILEEYDVITDQQLR